MLKSCHPSSANRAGSEIDEPTVLACSSFSWLTNAMWQSSGDSVMYAREKASLSRHAFSFSVHIPRSLWSNDIQMSPQQTLLCQSGCVTAVPMTTSFPTQSQNKNKLSIRYAIFSCSDVAKQLKTANLHWASTLYVSLQLVYLAIFRYKVDN